MMKQPYRLPSGGRIERDQPLSFTFDGCHYQGFAGDTLASALLANGVRLVGRSFKFHRPRGILGVGAEEPNALFRLGQGAFAEPNVRATLQPLYEGLEAHSQNCWPSLNNDLGALADRVAGLLPAGFYNKTFKWPNWHVWEGFIRRAAGLGTLPEEDDPDIYSQRNAHCDVLVCGGGPAGLAAASAAADSGARVILLDEQTELGGCLRWSQIDIDGSPAPQWAANTIAMLAENPRVTLLTKATASGFFDHNILLVSQRLDKSHGLFEGPRERLWKIRAKDVIIATGTIEQPLMFPNNDRPGVMLASAVGQYLHQYAVMAGNNVVVATNNDSAYQTAIDLHDAGVNIPALLDSRAISRSHLVEEVRKRNIKILQHSFLLDTEGRKAIKEVQVARRDTAAPKGFRTAEVLSCDAVAMSGGWQPAVHLFSQARGKLRYDENYGVFRPDQFPPHVHVAGAANGAVSLSSVLKEGYAAGLAATNANPEKIQGAPICIGSHRDGWHPERFLVPHKPERQWVDFQHDVTIQDIDIAVQENFVSVEHLKRYTTTGMSVDQGKTSNINALYVLSRRLGKPIQEVGTTTFRPFYLPVTLGSIAPHRRGELYSLLRRSPMHEWQQQAGGLTWNYGHWQRPAAYPRSDETLAQAMQREARGVRDSVGIYDGSPLGKIEVTGPDAAAFLNRLYINNLLTLKPGKARYGIMLNENGVVIDDGIVACLRENHYLVHTTSGNANHIFEWMEEWHQCEWPNLQVILTRVTTQWANVAVSGPNARSLVASLGISVDLDNEQFPHMSIREGKCQGIPVRIMRASFTGELGYEINVPADYGFALWQQLLENGKALDVTPYGVESLMLLRTEKGYLHIGADTDGNTTPADIGWGPIVEKKQDDFIGKRSLSRPYNQKSNRLQLVGLEVPPKAFITSGTHILGAEKTKAPASSQGYVTSAFYSPHLSRYVALALVKNGVARVGDKVNLLHKGKVQTATIVKPVFIDQEGERLHG